MSMIFQTLRKILIFPWYSSLKEKVSILAMPTFLTLISIFVDTIYTIPVTFPSQ